MRHSLQWSKPVSKSVSTRTAICQNIYILQSIQNLPCLFLHRKQYFTCPKTLHPQLLGKGDANESNWGKGLYEDKGYFHTLFIFMWRRTACSTVLYLVLFKLPMDLHQYFASKILMFTSCSYIFWVSLNNRCESGFTVYGRATHPHSEIVVVSN